MKRLSNASFSLAGNDEPRELCGGCSLIDFDQFLAQPHRSPSAKVSIKTITISLYDVMKHRKKVNCKFCTLLFDAIVKHDPLQNPIIKDYLPPELEGLNFRTWVDEISSTFAPLSNVLLRRPHPFGRSRERIELEKNESDTSAPVLEVRNEDREDAEELGVVALATGAGAASRGQNNNQNGVLAGVGSAGIINAAILAARTHKLPVVISVLVHNLQDVHSGLLEVKMWGYGNRVRAPLSLLCSFNLRVVSGYQVSEDGMDLHYGHIIEKELKVATTCRHWLDHCRNQHKKACQNPDWAVNLTPPSRKSFRLIEITNDRWRVVHAKTMTPTAPLPEYAALSYVWGKNARDFLQLRRDTLPLLIDGFAIPDDSAQETEVPPEETNGMGNQPPKTILDAIRVTRDLGFRYLWVDSFCIMQEDQQMQEKTSQIEQMDRIYGHASLVIVAASGDNANTGLAGISAPREVDQVASEIRPGIKVLLPIQYEDSYGTWDTRGWTFQEKLLSKRRLVFHKDYVSFHCRHCLFREDMSAGHAGLDQGPPPLPNLGVPPNSSDPAIRTNWDGSFALLRPPFFGEYAKLLEEYSSREMTEAGDILNGISGLLSVLEDMRSLSIPNSFPSGAEPSQERKASTLYGLPEEFLDLALLWQPPASRESRLTKRPGEKWPSWSWAGWEVKPPTARSTQDHEAPSRVRPGVRFEEPFWVCSNDDRSLKKVLATDVTCEPPEERLRPLVLWYKCSTTPLDSYLANHGPSNISVRRPPPPPPPPRAQDTTSPRRAPPPPPPSPSTRDPARRPVPPPPVPHRQGPGPLFPTTHYDRLNLIPVNGHGLGIVCGSLRGHNVLRESAARFSGSSNPSEGIDPNTRLDDRHLVCQTQVGRFRLREKEGLRTEPLWNVVKEEVIHRTTWLKKETKEKLVLSKVLEILEMEILDDQKKVVGYVIPTEQTEPIFQPGQSIEYDFILLSQSQYWGNEKRIDVVGFPLFNVMVVQWDENKQFATRLGLGKIHQTAWVEADTESRWVILR
ncbi:hypothetical protein CMUS01_02819 [Colletotrichum musicola]|uniref:Heterokaryon incompatibility domain-containing protein n=1 Tax=Colletotrichum musicola TaxID=2175873 RepID=A0A8H6U788_9PEZI|nr:hypothetical protein CMUS01_02819 [Colletotrichum musicola]